MNNLHERNGHYAERHGLSLNSIYAVHRNMKARCTNPRNKHFKNYGGRGIKVCDRWQLFDNFFADMGFPPEPKMLIERIDNNGNYEPSNCRWATRKEQSINRRNNHRLTLMGQSKTIAEWAQDTGCPYDTIRMRLKLGWPEELAVLAPKRFQFNPR